MANASWPATLPSYVLEQGYSETLADQTLDTQFEGGAPRRRRRSTVDNRAFSVTLHVDQAQSQTFEQFYDVTLAGGTLPFDWVHPLRQTAMTFAFRRPAPKVTEVGWPCCTWTFNLEARPG